MMGLVQLIFAEVSIALRDLDVLVARQVLGHLEVAAAAAQHRSNEIMPEGVGRDRARRVFSQALNHALLHDIAARSHRE